MNDGLAFKRRMPENRPRNLAIEPAWTRWPLETVQIVVRTENGRPPRSDIPSIPGVGEWERVWKLRDVENLYDLGFWDNLMDVFVPNYDFNGGRGVEPITERRSRKRKKAYSTRFT